MKRVFEICIAALLLVAFALSVSAAKPMQGDVNGDGKVSAADYMLLKRYVLRKGTLTEVQLAASNLNGDGRVNAVDYMLLKRVVLGKLCLHDYGETVVGNLHIFTCKRCGHQYEEFDGQLIG